MALRELTDSVLAFLDEMRVPCVIATLGPNGAPITSATWYGIVGGRIVISTPAAGNKARNARADARISFIVDRKERPYAGVAIEGTAEVLDDPGGELRAAIVERYLGPQPESAVRARLESRGPRVIIALRPDRIRPWGLRES